MPIDIKGPGRRSIGPMANCWGSLQDDPIRCVTLGSLCCVPDGVGGQAVAQEVLQGPVGRWIDPGGDQVGVRVAGGRRGTVVHGGAAHRVADHHVLLAGVLKEEGLNPLGAHVHLTLRGPRCWPGRIG